MNKLSEQPPNSTDTFNFKDLDLDITENIKHTDDVHRAPFIKDHKLSMKNLKE